MFSRLFYPTRRLDTKADHQKGFAFGQKSGQSITEKPFFFQKIFLPRIPGSFPKLIDKPWRWKYKGDFRFLAFHLFLLTI
jgi:hypothetical protein